MLVDCSRKVFFLISVLVFLPVFVHAQVLININTAGVADLKKLTDIGDVKAQAIVDYRTTSGSFQKIEDIMKVTGIKDGIFSKIKDSITVGNTATQSDSSTSISQDEATPYVAVPVTNSKTSLVSVSAGKDRIGVIGGPLEFKVETGGKVSDRRNSFRWNFGDGSEGNGLLVTHIYDYPGEYVVVLNTDFPEGGVVARVNVKIVDPGITATLATPERIELKNNSGYEANLFGRALIVGGRAFVFPRDTIIKAGQSISFSSKVTKLSPFNTSDVQIMVLGETENSKIVAKIEKQRLDKIAYLQNQISLLQRQMASMSPPQPNLAVRQLSEESVVAEIEDVKDVNTEQTALVSDSVPEAKSDRINGWLDTLKHFFFRTQR